MTEYEKREFVDGLISTVKEKIINNIPKMPEEWDGAELRMYIADKFQEVVWQSMKGKRRKFNNDVLVNNL